MASTAAARFLCGAVGSTTVSRGWFEYWADGQQANPQKLPASPVVANSAYKNVTFSETPSRLSPGTLYPYQLCGQGDQNITQR